MTIAPLAIYFLYFIFSHPDSELCTPETRTQECIADGFAPVCAIYTGDNCHSGTGFCYKTLSNSCDACVEDNIIGYTFGECQQPTLPQVCKDKQRGLNCEDELDDQSVCAYSKPRRFKGQKALIAHTKSNSCEACSAEQTVFHIPGACQQFETFGVCLDLKSEGCYEEQAGPLCVYYTGEDCTEKICRRTELNSCNVCQDSTVLFYTQGACAGYQVPMEYDDGPVQQDYIPELEAVLQEDGTTVYEEVPSKEEGSECSHETQSSIPELKAVVQEDGPIVYEEVEPTDEPEEAIEEYMPVVQADGSIVYEKVKDVIERMSEVGWPPEDCIRCVDPEEEVPEPKEESVVEKMAEIGWPPEDCIKCVDPEEPETTVPESVVEKMAEIGWPPEDCIKCVDPEEPETTVPESVIEKMAEIGWPPEDCINCVDPEEQVPEAVVEKMAEIGWPPEDCIKCVDPEEPETTVPESVIEKMAEIGWPPEDCIKCVDPEEPEIEAVAQEDDAVAFDKVQAAEVDYVESQENIPKIEAVIQPDGSVVYEEVQPSDEEEKVKPTPFFVTEVIESRFLGTEPSN